VLRTIIGHWDVLAWLSHQPADPKSAADSARLAPTDQRDVSTTGSEQQRARFSKVAANPWKSEEAGDSGP
jgi:hypothetical protein